MTLPPDRFDRYRDDTEAFWREVLRFTPWSKQLAIAEAVRDHDRVAVKAGNACGKTAAAAALVPWWLAGGPGSVVVTTAMTERQVKKVLWREVHRRMRRADGFFRGAVVTDTEVYLAADWFATGLSTDETESFQGWHGSRVLVIVDEASGVDERIFEAIQGVLAGGDAKLLLISNPLRTSGTFYDAHTRHRDEWKLLTISAFDSPNVPITAVRGYDSQSHVAEIAELIVADPRPSVLLYAGDFDPSGEDILRDFRRRVGDGLAEVRRVALDWPQVIAHDLPPQLGKATDSREAAFEAKHGRLVQVELEALPPEVLRGLYADALADYWDADAYRAIIEVEEAERPAL